MTGCSILQFICAVIIVLMVLLTLFLIMGVLATSGSVATATPGSSTGSLKLFGVAGVLIWSAINIGIVYIFYKIWGDCSDVQQILKKEGLSHKPKELARDIEHMKSQMLGEGVDVGVKATLPHSPIIDTSVEIPETQAI
jgi:hypothetical protein